MKKLSLAFALLFCVALFSGCGPARPEGMPVLVSCILTIEYEDGTPVAGALVTLVHDDPALRQWAIGGSTNSSGVVAIATNTDWAGAPAGSYKVVVSKVELVETGRVDVYGDPITGSASVISAEFTTAARTTLTLEIGNSAVRETLKVGNPVHDVTAPSPST